MRSDDRQLKVLEHIVDMFIETGEPVGSLTICERLKKSVSSATVRNDMVRLERLGFLKQPHTSAGRVPTFLGFREYINRLMKPKHLSCEEKLDVDRLIEKDVSSVSAVVENAAVALSEFTDLAVVATSAAQKFFVISKVEVIEAGKRIYSVLLVASSGEVKNKVCRLDFEINEEQLDFFKKLINKSLVGNTVEILNKEMLDSLVVALGSYIYSLSPLLKALCEITDEILKREVNLKGEENLLKYKGLKADEIMKFITAKDKIEDILSGAFSGINILFGKENETFVVANSSFIISKYGIDETFGSFGVIGPIRLNYKKILPYVSYFSQKITSLVENIREELRGGEGCEKTAKED